MHPLIQAQRAVFNTSVNLKALVNRLSAHWIYVSLYLIPYRALMGTVPTTGLTLARCLIQLSKPLAKLY